MHCSNCCLGEFDNDNNNYSFYAGSTVLSGGGGIKLEYFCSYVYSGMHGTAEKGGARKI